MVHVVFSVTMRYNLYEGFIGFYSHNEKPLAFLGVTTKYEKEIHF